jgi:hypothetical protein
MGTFPITGGPGNRARIPWILVNPGSGGVPGADETRNPGIGDPQLDQGTLVGHPPPLARRYWLFGSTVRSWLTYYDL